MSQNSSDNLSNELKTSNGNNEPITVQTPGPKPIYSPQQIDGVLRPQLIRTDSRTALPPRPGFPNFARPPQTRLPTNPNQFIQRQQTPMPRVATSNPNIFSQNQINSVPRPQFQHQQSVGERPQFYPQRPPNPLRQPFNSNSLYRSPTLDSSETNLNLPNVDNNVAQSNSGKTEIDRPFVAPNNGVNIHTANTTVEAAPTDRRRLSEHKEEIATPNLNIHQKSNIKDNSNTKITEENINSESLKSESQNVQKNLSSTLNKSEFGNSKPTNGTPEPASNKDAGGRKQLDLKPPTSFKPKKFPSEGDEDSGVDEATQRNANGDNASPKRFARSPACESATTPSKIKSFSRGERSPSLKSPGPANGSETKKLSMNKIQVGSAPSPNLKVVKSKIGSLQNATHKPGGGNIKIENRKIDYSSTASSRIAAKNDNYTPRGGDKKIQQQKLTWNAKSKIGSLENASHKPQGGDKKIENLKLNFKDKAKPKVGSKDNMKYSPGGGDVKIESKKLEIKGQSKIGSLDNIKHKPGGGDKKIYEDKEYIRQISAHSNVSLSNSHNSSQTDVREPVSDENLNRER